MRVARMPYVYPEKGNSNRFEFRRRYPADVVRTLGKRFFIHKYPSGLTRQQCNELADHQLAAFKARVAAARGGAYDEDGWPTDPAERAQRYVRELQELAVRLNKTNEIQRRRFLAYRLGQAIVPQETNGAVVDYESVIQLWMSERTAEGKPPKQKAVEYKRTVIKRLFDWLNKTQGYTGRDIAAVRIEVLQAYKEHLMKLGLAHNHLHEIKYLYRVAARNNRLSNGNPAEKLYIPNKAKGTPRKPFTDAEARLILESARQSNDPLIRWAHWLAAFTGTITDEIVQAKKSEFKRLDGVWVWDMTERRVTDMKTAYRPRGIPIHPSLIREGLLGWLQSLPNGRIFDVDATRASARLMRHIRGLAIENEKNEDGEVVAEKVFYSWRHRFISALEDTTTADRARFLAGHAGRDVHARNYLHHEMPRLVKAIEELEDPTVG